MEKGNAGAVQEQHVYSVLTASLHFIHKHFSCTVHSGKRQALRRLATGKGDTATWHCKRGNQVHPAQLNKQAAVPLSATQSIIGCWPALAVHFVGGASHLAASSSCVASLRLRISCGTHTARTPHSGLLQPCSLLVALRPPPRLCVVCCHSC